jgi:hypothetical protein
LKPKLKRKANVLTLDFLQPMGKVEKGWISGTFLVICKDQTAIFMQAFTNKTATNMKTQEINPQKERRE